MTITLIGFALAPLGVFAFLFRPHWLAPLAVFFIPFSATAIVNVSSVSFGLSPAIFFGICLIARMAATGDLWRARGLSDGHRALLVLLTVFWFATAVSTAASAVEQRSSLSNLTQFGYLTFGIGFTAAFSLALTDPDALRRTLTALRASVVFVCLWGVVQVATNAVGAPYPAFLFNNSGGDFADMFDQSFAGGVTRISSVAVEPSFLAFSLGLALAFGATACLRGDRALRAAWAPVVLFSAAVVFGSTSSTGYMAMAGVLALVCIYRPPVAVALGVAGLAGLLILSLVEPAFVDAVRVVTLGKFETFSFNDRLQTIIRGVDTFRDHPFAGAGWGASFAFSLPVLLLANAGVLGVGAFSIAVLATLVYEQRRRRALLAVSPVEPHGGQAVLAGARNAFLLALLIMTASGFRYQVLDFWFYWALAIASLSTDARTAPVRAAVKNPSNGKRTLRFIN
ncbi:MAG: O-antigen ligase family protein [Pseudomonadota bacterium]